MAILSEVNFRGVLYALVALSVLGQCSSLQEDVFVLEDKDRPERKTIVVVTRTDEGPVDCVTLRNKMVVENIVSSQADYALMKFSGKEIRNILKECKTFSKPRKRREENDEEGDDIENCNDSNCDDDCEEDHCDVQEAEDMWNIIFPGTRWCGNGNISRNNDLGVLKDTDKCCRSHDFCNDTILTGETRHNITNDSKFTLLSCECDDEFYACLANVSSTISNTIGRVYFNILKRPCFKKDYPLTGKCKTYTSILHITCKEKERNTTVPEVYMLRDPPKRYKKLPLPIVG